MKYGSLYQVTILMILFLLLTPVVQAGPCGPSKGLFSGAILDESIILPTGDTKDNTVTDVSAMATTKPEKVTQNTEDWVTIGDQQFLRGMYKEAVESYDQALTIDRKNTNAWNGKMASLLNLDQNEEVLKVFNEAEKEIPEDEGIWVNRGRAHYYSYEYQEAYKDVEKALAINNSNIWALAIKAESLVNNGEPEAALEAADKVLSIDPENTEVLAARGSALFVLDRYDEAIEDLNKAIAANPKMPCQYVDLYNAYMNTDKNDAAFQTIEKFLEKTDLASEGMLSQGAGLLNDYMKKTDWRSNADGVRKTWEFIFSQAKQDSEEWKMVVDALGTAPSYTKDSINKTEEGEDTKVWDYPHDALILEYQNKYKTSPYLGDGWEPVMVSLNKALEDFNFTDWISNNDSFSGQDVLTLAEQQLSYDPSDKDALALQADASSYLEMINLYPDATDKPIQTVSSDKIVVRDSKSLLTSDEYYAKAAALVEEKNLEEALTVMDEAVNTYSKNASLWSSRGAVLNNLKEYDDALDSVDTALKLDPNLAHAWYVKGFALEKQGKPEEALIYYEKAYELKPDWNEAAEAVKNIKADLQN